MKLTLQEWNKRYFTRPRSKRMLFNYIKDGLIFPPPTKEGREYAVEHNAILLNQELIQNPMLLKERLHEQAKRRKY